MSEEKTRDIEEKYQTEPTIETVVKMIRELGGRVEQGFAAIGARLDGMEASAEEFRKEVRRQFRVLYEDVQRGRVDQEELKDRVSELEKNPA